MGSGEKQEAETGTWQEELEMGIVVNGYDEPRSQCGLQSDERIQGREDWLEGMVREDLRSGKVRVDIHMPGNGRSRIMEGWGGGVICTSRGNVSSLPSTQ